MDSIQKLRSAMVPFETKRLILREFLLSDAKDIYELNLDPEVIQYTGDISFADIPDALAFLHRYDHYQTYGFGRWAVVRKSDSSFLGWCGLKYTEDLDEFDIGFRFKKEFWNKGYATEAARKCMEVGIDQFKIKKIHGRCMEENTASRVVLGKIGLKYIGHKFEDRAKLLIYSN